MNKKKTFVGMALLIAVLVLGVGYAAITDIPLFVNGTATANASDSDFSVKFDKTAAITKSDENLVTKAEIDAEDDTDLTATLTVENLTTTNNTASATFTIKNYSADLKAGLTATVYNEDGTTAYSDDYFSVTPTFGATTLNVNDTEGNSTTLTVEVKLIKTPTDTVSKNFKVKVTANAQAS